MKPYTIYVESTPNPEVMKFVANQILTHNSIEINSIKNANKIKIGKALFNFPFVKHIFINTNFISITKHNNAEWGDIAMLLRVFIVDFLNDESVEDLNQIIEEKTQEKEEFNSTLSKYNKEEIEINNLLNEYITPAVESDGGSIVLDSFKNGVVTVILKGSCNGCPSATVTLKQGIEQLLKEKIGEKIKEVCAKQ